MILLHAALWTFLIRLPVAETPSVQSEDVLVADFEGETYGDWKVQGDAFGPGPARGTLANQMAVTGFLGKGLVNSYFHGDDTTGQLTSPPFRVERKFINFLVGGGGYAGETCINLLVEGKVLHTATGPNTRPGGSEQLEWHSWDVSPLIGRMATIEIVDSRKGGWGHINVDHIVQSNSRKQAEPRRRELVIERRYLHFPVKTGAAKRQVRLAIDGQTVREFEIELADASTADFWAFCDVSSFASKRMAIEAMLPGDANPLDAISQDDRVRGTGTPVIDTYAEKNRPQFHFTSRRGWLNDPNGLVHFQGEYHLFYQHNPYGWGWGNMHWGHAVSSDLLHWKELPIALYPQRFGDWCFSGSAIVDARNSSGLGTGKEDLLVAAYTSTGRGESIVTSVDRGRTWREYEGNPVVRHSGRDPKLLWHEPSHRWVMAVYDELDGKRNISFYASADLKKWEFQSRIDDFFECPDLFELPVSGANGKPAGSKWVLYAADGQYVLGDFDGSRFSTESGKHRLWYGNFYAAQTYSNAPDGRRIQIGWGQGIEFRGMPFNQQMTIPVDLTLRGTPEGPRMFAEPVRELERLRGPARAMQNLQVVSSDTAVRDFNSDLCDVRAEFEIDAAAPPESFGVTVRGVPIQFDVSKRTLTCRHVVAPLQPDGGRVQLRILVDRGSIEVFGNSGRVALSVAAAFPDTDHSLSVFARGGTVRVPKLEAFELKSAWKAE
jgi:fructan beta-fructosidase